MKKHTDILKTALCGGLFCLMLSSCTDWLDVQPRDKMLEDRVYSSAGTIERACNGLYLKMAKNSLYGQDMTTYAIELLGQKYMVENGNGSGVIFKYNAANFNWAESTVKSRFDAIWASSYNLILDINLFIQKLSATSGVISQSKKDLLLGEAYGLRAYIYLDLLRLYGPVYADKPDNQSIPFYDVPDPSVHMRLKASEIMTRIIGDLDTAIGLLKNDPVRTDGVMVSDNLAGDFYTFRNRRMNYYAASALKARALLYAGNKTEAGALAGALLEETEVPAKFPWTTISEITSATKTDRIFSSEVLFGIKVSNMYNDYNTYFSTGILDQSVLLASTVSRLNAVFGTPYSISSDTRVLSWMGYPHNAKFVCTMKLSRSIQETLFWDFQPLLRKSELYLILAECSQSVEPLNVLRNARRTLPLEGTYVLQNEIRDEYWREFTCEGQMFFYYKRLNTATIPSYNGVDLVTMTTAKYIAPIPDSELEK